MGKKKLIRFEQNRNFRCLFESRALELIKAEHPMRGGWAQNFFNNSNPIVLELGCGKGEYTVNLAKMYPEKNFIGVDIKGSRLFFGASTVEEENLGNACFVRTQIELINRVFAREISEIWITFPDPLPLRARHRLTAPRFLQNYRQLLQENGRVNMKTDDYDLFEFTREIALQNDLEIISQTSDLYESDLPGDFPDIKTTYEQRYLELGRKICLLSFKLNKDIAPIK